MIEGNKGAGLPVCLATALAVAAILLIFIMVFAFALPVFSADDNGINAHLFSWQWKPAKGQFGILPMVAGSLALSCLAVTIAFPIAAGIAFWLQTRPNQRKPRHFLPTMVALVIRFMTAIPTVVYGFVAVFLLVPFIRQILSSGSGLNLLSAALILALLILPTMVLVMDTGLKPRMEHLSFDTAALGFNRRQTLIYFVLPAARQCLLTALLLGFSRAMGDTLISLMLSGNWPQLPLHFSDSLRTLTAHMALVTANEVGGIAYNSLFAAGALLLLINASISLIVRRLGEKQI
ncbi:phosphate ABC transporter membrane protein 1 (PhoT family) [Mesocricetibacter intestinalis]|uniref:Phosphate ABC transporter membrane protein 1 (PhoT family) n=1 Tax=Mesocricetibacter intestinalis TaxID=1521930 RepID=A0A4R6VBZ3_9PAST|nr:ABC transporter permease subunit [Mesocricetibacter intestinalis]TDQ59747.1 phosphate ABC transporter membrane protein 1 (PhoT family) [Mesocricetibacter intestinalis]